MLVEIRGNQCLPRIEKTLCPDMLVESRAKNCPALTKLCVYKMLVETRVAAAVAAPH